MPDKTYDFSETLPDLDAGMFAQKLSRAYRAAEWRDRWTLDAAPGSPGVRDRAHAAHAAGTGGLAMTKPICSGREVRDAVESGWELWHIGRRDGLPGSWELRRGRERCPVHWDAIIRLRKNLRWWEENTEETEYGLCWCYRLRQEQREFAL